jgi:Sec7 domain
VLLAQDFLRNNRGIDDGGDLPQDFMTALYDRIVGNEIKMKDNWMEGMTAAAVVNQQQSWLDSILNLIPGRKQASSNEPSDDAIRRTHEFLRWALGRPRASSPGLAPRSCARAGWAFDGGTGSGDPLDWAHGARGRAPDCRGAERVQGTRQGRNVLHCY